MGKGPWRLGCAFACSSEHFSPPHLLHTGSPCWLSPVCFAIFLGYLSLRRVLVGSLKLGIACLLF